MLKKELVVYLDVGLIGTFVKFEAHRTEDDYVYLDYIPLNKFPPKKKRFEKPIPKDSIHFVNSLLDTAGIVDRLVIIYTAEEGSIIKGILETDYKKQIEELKEKVKSLEMKNASLTQEVENARSGVSKTLASMKSITRLARPKPSIFSPFGSSSEDREDDDFADEVFD